MPSQCGDDNFLGFVPADPFANHGLGMLTTFFVHSGFAHFLGNMAFLLVFGDNVEDLVGHARYAVLLIAGTVCASWAHALVTTSPGSTLVGASGGISSILAFYALAFPDARLRLFYFSRHPVIRTSSGDIPPFGWVALPVRYWFAIWILIQPFILLIQVSSTTRVSAAAHIGGSAIGVLAWWWLGRGTSALPPR